MRFILTNNGEQGIAALGKRLADELGAGHSVLWLTSGGSNTAATVEVMKNLSAGLTSKLTIMLVDERYGQPDHANSNWLQLQQAASSPSSFWRRPS